MVKKATHSDLLEKIKKIQKLMAVPHVFWQLMGLIRDDRTSVKDLAPVINGDPALVSKILSLANSAYYSRGNPVTTIERAVIVLGYQELSFMVLGSGLVEHFDSRRVADGFDCAGLWRHSLAVSVTAGDLARAAGYPDPGEITIAGLLHDIGKLVIATHLKDEYSHIVRLADEGVPFFEAEQATGLEHAGVGGILARAWGLPEVHVRAISGHHDTRPVMSFAPSTSLVTLANELVKELGFGTDREGRPMDLQAGISTAGLDEDTVKKVKEKAAENLPEALSSWQSVVNPGG